MKPEGLKVLAERASTVEGRAAERLDEVHARISRAKGRRQLGAVAAAVIAVVLVLSAATVVLRLAGEDTPPANPPRPAVTPSNRPEKPDDDRPAARPLVWAEGETIHVGKRAIDADREVHDIDATDDGAVFVTGPSRSYGPNRIWFTDGSDPVLIGPASGRGWAWDVVTSTTGPYVVWFQTDEQVSINSNDGEHVVYDTAKQQVAARFGGSRGSVRGFHGAYVYWIPDDRAWCLDFDRYHGECRRYKGIMRLEVSTGRQEQVSWAAYLRGRLTQPRTFVQDDSARRQVEEGSPYFWRVGRRLVPIGGRPPSVVGYDYRDNTTKLSVAHTGEPVRLRVPAGCRAADVFQLAQWLDDDLVAVFAYCCGAEHAGYRGYPFGGSETGDSGDLFTCRLSSGTCTLAVKRSENGFDVPLAE